MTNNQLDVMCGSLLGDGSVVFSGKRSKNAMYKIKQRLKSKSYVQFIYNSLNEYVSCGIREYTSRKPSRVNGNINHSIKNWDGEYCTCSYFWSKSHADFTELRNKWYLEGKKIVPKDITLNPRTLAHWYAEDGSNNATSKSKGVFLYTNSFLEEDVLVLIKELDKLGLEAKMYAGPIIRIMSGSYFDFIAMVKPHMDLFGCFDYKTNITGVPNDKKGEIWKGPKLDMRQVNEIRDLRTQGKKLKEIAEMYNVSTGTIGKIVNYQMYKPSLRLSGSAQVKIGYKHGNHQKGR